MEYSISQLARMAGVSPRTLRHYDQLGLLAPSRVSANGYRWYQRRELLLLQRILLLKELAVPLPRIAEILAGEADEVAALRHHREQLVMERERLDRVISTVEHTLAGLAGEQPVTDAEFFIGLAEGQERLRADLLDRYGDGVEAHLAAAAEATAEWDRADHEQAAAEGRELLTRMSQARSRGVAPDSDEALDLVAEHHRGVVALWPANAATYRALGDLVVDNAQQHDMVAEVDPHLPHWLSAAIEAYADRRLS